MLKREHLLTSSFMLSLVFLVRVISASPQPTTSNSSDYTFLVASGYVCDLSDSRSCPAVALAANGDTIELNGAGTLSLANKSIIAAGTFIHKSSTGEAVGTGIWTATELLSFKSHGIAPGALIRGSQTFRASRISALGLGMLAGPMPAGGLALLRIRLLPDIGTPKDAILQVNCALGKVPCEPTGRWG